MTLPLPMIARLQRLIPMLASIYDGEVIATRNAIVRELGSIGGSPEAVPEPITTARRPHPDDGFFSSARACRDLDNGRLNERERSFVAGMCAIQRPPTEKRAEWLRAIHARLIRRAA